MWRTSSSCWCDHVNTSSVELFNILADLLPKELYGFYYRPVTSLLGMQQCLPKEYEQFPYLTNFIFVDLFNSNSNQHTIKNARRGSFETDANGHAMLPKKLWNSKIPTITFVYRSIWAQNFIKVHPSEKDAQKNWAAVRPRSAWEQLSEMFNSNRRDSESSIDIDRQNQWLRYEIWTGRARYGLRPTLWSECSQHGRWYVADAGQASDTRTFDRWCVSVENRRQKNSIPSDGNK